MGLSTISLYNRFNFNIIACMSAHRIFTGGANPEASQRLKGIFCKVSRPTCGIPTPTVVFHFHYEEKSLTVSPGASIPISHWSISPLFQISPSFLNISQSEKISPTFPQNLGFIRQNFWLLLLIIDSQFIISPYFRYNNTFPHYFVELFTSPYFDEFPLWFRKICFTCFRAYVFFVSPYFDHDAFMHHAMNVLDTSGCLCVRLCILVCKKLKTKIQGGANAPPCTCLWSPLVACWIGWLIKCQVTCKTSLLKRCNVMQLDQ